MRRLRRRFMTTGASTRRGSTAWWSFWSPRASMASASAARRGSIRISKRLSARPSFVGPRNGCRAIAGCSSASAPLPCGARSRSARPRWRPGSRALLLPMPMFFRYQQEDLRAFAAHVSRALEAPCLLYDLPDFTNGLAPSTVLALMRDEEFIVGIKDSSGREENLKTFADARADGAATLLVGDDRLLARRPAGRVGRRHFGRRRLLPRAAGGDRAQSSRRTPRRHGEAASPARRAHRPAERVSDSVGDPDRARGPRVTDRAAALATDRRATGANP